MTKVKAVSDIALAVDSAAVMDRPLSEWRPILSEECQVYVFGENYIAKRFDQINYKFCENNILKGEVSPKEYEFLRYKKTQLYLALSKKSCSDVSEWISSKTVNQCIKSIRDKVDFAIIDTPPTSVSADAMSLIKMADKAILVVRTDVVDAADINDTVLTIKNVGGGFAGCLLNDVYKPFTFFGNMGTDDGGYSIYRRSSYRRYKNYSKENASLELLDSDLSE